MYAKGFVASLEQRLGDFSRGRDRQRYGVTRELSHSGKKRQLRTVEACICYDCGS